MRATSAAPLSVADARPIRALCPRLLLSVLVLPSLTAGGPVHADDHLSFRFATEGDTQTWKDSSLRLRWAVPTGSVDVTAFLFDEWNFDPNGARSSDDFRHGSYVGAAVRAGSERDGFSFSGLLSAGRYDGFDVSSPETGLAGDVVVRYRLGPREFGDLALVGGFAATQRNYVGLEDVTDRKDLDDPFADPGWTRVRAGGEASSGNVTYSLTGVMERAYRSDIEGRQKRGLDLGFVYADPTNETQSVSSSWRPRSAYATLQYRTIDFEPASALRDDTSLTLNLGGFWSIGKTQIDVSFENYDYDTGNRSLLGTDSRGYSLDTGVGYWGEPWSSYLYASFSESEDVDSSSESRETEIDTSLSIFYDFQNFPELEFKLRYYDFDATYSGIQFETQQAAVGVGIDLIEFLEPPLKYDTEFKVAVEYIQDTTFDGFSGAARRTSDDVAFAVSFKVSR